MKERNQIDDKYKWDLTKFCKNDEDFYEKLENLRPFIEKIKKFEGKLSNDDMLLECWETCDEFSLKSGMVECYVYFMEDEDQRDCKAQEMSQKLAKVLTSFSEASSYITPEIADFTNEKLEELNSTPFTRKILAKYKDLSIRNLEHILESIYLESTSFYHFPGQLVNFYPSIRELKSKNDHTCSMSGGKIKKGSFY